MGSRAISRATERGNEPRRRDFRFVNQRAYLVGPTPAIRAAACECRVGILRSREGVASLDVGQLQAYYHLVYYIISHSVARIEYIIYKFIGGR